MMRLAIVALAGLIVPGALGQSESIIGPTVLATFQEACAVAVDPAGNIYVVDAGKHVVTIMESSGSPVFVLGGAGAGEGEFDEPRGVDPTNGLIIVVADAGNARLQRFTRAYQLIESIPLYGQGPDPVGSGAASGPGSIGRERGGTASIGRPIAVAVSGTNEIFAIDESRRAVAKWNSSRRFVGLIGAANDFGDLDEPVDIEILGDLIMVADRQRKAIVVFDQFGGYVTDLGGGQLEGISGLTSSAGLVIAAYGPRIGFFDPEGIMLGSVDVGVGAVRDVGVVDNRLLVLTAKKLFTMPLPDLSVEVQESYAPRQKEDAR